MRRKRHQQERARVEGTRTPSGKPKKKTLRNRKMTWPTPRRWRSEAGTFGPTSEVRSIPVDGYVVPDHLLKANVEPKPSRRKLRCVVVGNDGDPCPRCGAPTEVREHPAITPRELRRAYYYARWFNCTNGRCQTTLIMPDRYIVWNDAEKQRQAAAAEWSARQLTPPEGWL
jgi:hypothetical protein